MVYFNKLDVKNRTKQYCQLLADLFRNEFGVLKSPYETIQVPGSIRCDRGPTPLI